MKKIFIIFSIIFTLGFSFNKTNVKAETKHNNLIAYESNYNDYFLDDEDQLDTELCDKESEFLKLFIGWGALCLIFKLFFVFRQKRIVETVEFNVPDGMDPIAVGYYIDGNVDDKEIVAMFLYFNQKGYLKIENNSKDMKGADIIFIKTNEISDDEPEYAKKLFNIIFPEDKVEFKPKDMSVVFAKKYQSFVNSIIKELEKEKTLYSVSSRIIRCICMLTTIVLFLVAAFNLNSIALIIFAEAIAFAGVFWSSVKLVEVIQVKNEMETIWHVFLFCLATVAFSAIFALITAFLKGDVVISIIISVLIAITMLVSSSICALNDEYISMIGKLRGFKNFLATVEMDKFNKLVMENPNYYLEILPYIYSFELSDRFVEYINYSNLDPDKWAGILNISHDFNELTIVLYLTVKMIDKTLKMNGIRINFEGDKK